MDLGTVGDLLAGIPVLTSWQYQLVYNVLSFTFAAMLAAFVYFLVMRSSVAAKYRSAITISAIICGIAAYHYWRIFTLWGDGRVNEGYRYADWLLTVPLLLAELVIVAGIAKDKRTGMMTKLVVAALLMVALGYPGEVAASGDSARLWWFVASMIPFLYILWVLFFELGKAAESLPAHPAKLLSMLRIIIIVVWSVYPVVYLLGDPKTFLSKLFDLSAADSVVVRQTLYSVADVLAKPVYGLIILAIAKAMTASDGASEDSGDSELTSA